MAQIRKIRKRMVATATIQRITKTMQMIATAKFTAAVQRAKATRPYADTLARLVGEVAEAAGDVEHPLLATPATRAGRSELLLVLSSERGLCGAYNAHVLRAASAHIHALQAAGTPCVVETSGKKAASYFKFARIDVSLKHSIGDRPEYADAEKIASRYIDELTAGQHDAVRVAYMRFVSSSRQVPEVLQLLPIEPTQPAETAAASSEAAAARSAVSYEFSPSEAALLDDLLPLAVKAQLFQAFNDAVVSEQVMRMVAMKAATESANDFGRLLNRHYNRARQAQITTELSEIIGGTAALE